MRTHQGQANLERYLRDGKRQALPRGQVLHFSEAQMMVAILDSGYVKRYMLTNDGSQSIQSIYGPGDVFPLTPVFKALFDEPLYKGQETFYYEAITPIALHAISQEQFMQLMQDDPSLYKDLLFVCGIRLRSNIQRLENISLKSALKQVAHQLVFMAEQFGTEQEGTIVLEVPLTHQTLASILNLARETVTQSINRLVERGVIKTDPKLCVVDLDGLRRAAS